MTNGMVSVVMPAYNESAFIASNLREVVEAFDSFGTDFEVILVDDGSSDHTYLYACALILERPERMRIVRYDQNQGKGNALMAGAACARGEYVIFLDADMDLHPSQIPGFFDIMARTGADAVIGSKLHPKSQVNYPGHRRIYSLGYYCFVWMLFGLPLRDTQTGMKVFKAALLRDVLPRVLAKRFAFDIEVLAIAHKLGYKITDAPVVLNFSRGFGRIDRRVVWQIFVDTLAIFYRLRIRHYYDVAHNPGLFTADTRAAREVTLEDARALARHGN